MKSSPWFFLLVPLGIAAIMTPAIVLASGDGGEGFDAVVHGIESRYHVHANRIPFLGLIGGVARISTHGGVRGLRMAEIENLQGPVDGDELTALVESRAGSGWQRIIRETGRGGDEQSLIYVRPEGDRVGMLVMDLDHKQVNLVQVSVDPDQLSREISHHRHGKNDDATGDDKDSKTDNESD